MVDAINTNNYTNTSKKIIAVDYALHFIANYLKK